MSHNHSYTAKVERQPKSTALVSVSVSAETLADHRALAIESLKREISVDGFRKGHVPEKVIIERVGEMAVLTEAAEIVIRHIYHHILEDEKLDPIGSPEVSITKLAPGNPLEYTMRLSLVPLVGLPDYKKIATNAKYPDTAVTEKDMADAIERIQRQKLAYDRLQAKAGNEAPVTEEEDFSKLPLPELTDEYAKTLGNFETVDALKTEIKSHLQSEKELEAKSKHRAEITDKIIEGASIELPDIFIASEIEQMFKEMESDIARAGLSFDDYLAHMKKTRDDLKKEWAPTAEKRAKLQLILNEIAKQENIIADKERADEETKMLLDRFKDADPVRVRVYVESTLKNEATLAMLEKLSEKK